MQDLPAPPAEPALLYVGHVMHQRLRPVAHRFRYSVFALLVDLDRLEAAGRRSPLFSVGRFNLLSFRPEDHGAVPGAADIAGKARGLFAEAGLATPVARLMLLCYPRILGFAFNPIAVYFAYDAAGRPLGQIYEVRNTFGERHSYVAPLAPGEASAAGIRQEAEKLFYVSPFLPQGLRYRFRLRPPNEADVALRILETDADGPVLAASFSGQARPVSAREILKLTLAMPLMTLKVVAGIHAEAARLWLKGLPFHARPKRPPAASHRGAFLGEGPAPLEPGDRLA